MPMCHVHVSVRCVPGQGVWATGLEGVCVCVCVCVCARSHAYTLGGDSGILSQTLAYFQGTWSPNSPCSSLFCLLLSTYSACSINMC